MQMIWKKNWGYLIEKIKYTPDAADKLRELKQVITQQYGTNRAKEIINLYHEREDFMWQLFGIDTTPQETIDHWDEQNAFLK